MQNKSRILMIVSEFNRSITQNLLEGALETLNQHGFDASHIHTVWVPGAFELPTAASVAAETKKWDAICLLGCLIQGETPHFDYISSSVSQLTAQLGVKHQIPIIFGVLTTDTLEQAKNRSIPIQEIQQKEQPSSEKKLKIENKGHEAALALVSMFQALESIRKA